MIDTRMYSHALSSHATPALLRRMTRRIGPLGLIILLHAGFLYALQHGLERHTLPSAAPKTVYVSFVTPDTPKVVETPKPEPKPEPPKPQPKPEPKPHPKPAPKPVIKKTEPTPAVVTEKAPERAISTPAAPPAPPAPPSPPSPQVAAAPAAPPAPPSPPAPIEPRLISSGIEYIEAPRPAYPAISRRMGEEGKVVMRILVNERGRPERVEIHTSSGSSRLDDAAKQAAMRAVFKPHIENGRPVAVYALVPIRFQLDS